MWMARIFTEQCLATALGRTDEEGRKPVSMRVFKSWWVENLFAKAHPITPIIWFGPLLAWALASSIRGGIWSLARGLAWFLAGWFVWTLLEYVLHRYLFHMPHRGTPSGRLRAFLVHGYHHEFPSDPMRLVAPPMMSWPIAAVVATAYLSLLGPRDWLQAFAGTTAGYIAYDWIHYYTHHFRPRNRLGKWLRAYHMLHHHEDDGTRFGISSPLWDFVFGTYRGLGARRLDRARAAGPG